MLSFLNISFILLSVSSAVRSYTRQQQFLRYRRFMNKGCMCNDGNRQAESFTSPLSYRRDILNRMTHVAKAVSILTPVVILYPLSKVVADDKAIYIDKGLGYYLQVPPGWFVSSEKKSTPQITRYASENVVFSATNFAEGTSMSVTQSNARQLLKDFDVEWWFAPLNKFTDLGSSELVANLLILQRQGEFEKKTTASELLDSTIDDSYLTFSFSSPLAAGVNRKTISKAFYKNGDIITIWISGLQPVFEGDYAGVLSSFRNAFTSL